MKIIFIRFFFLTLFMSLCWSSWSQNFSFEEFKNEKDSSRRIELAIESWNHYLRNDLDSIRIVGYELVDNDSLVLYAIGKRNLGSYYSRTNDIKKGVELLYEAREMFSNLHLMILLSETENELGNAFFLQGDYNQASHYYFESMVHGSGTADVTARYNGMIGFGKTVCAVGDTTKGLLFVHEYLESCLRDNKFESASDACGYLGMIAGANGRIELMSAYYGRGIRYASRSNSKTHRANAYTNKAIDYFYHDQVDSAVFYFYEALKLRKEVGATRPVVESLYNLALLNIESGKFGEAKIFAKEAESLSETGGIKSWQLDCLQLLLEVAQNDKDENEIIRIELDMERIRGELKKIGSIDGQIVNAAIEFTDLNKNSRVRSYFWETIAICSIVLSCCLLLYQERISSI